MTGDLRALTVRQPWAEAIADGLKATENRSAGFPKRYRGLLLVHAGKGWSRRGHDDERIRQAWHEGSPNPWARGPFDKRHAPARDYAIWHGVAYHGRPPPPFQAGAVLAVADLVDVHPAAGCCAPWGEETYPPANPEARPPGRVTHLTLERIVRLPAPVPARGALGLWRPDEDLTLEVAHRLADLVDWDAGDLSALTDRADVAQLHALVADDHDEASTS